MIKKLFQSADLSELPSRRLATVLLAVGGYVNTGITVVQGLLLVPLYLYFIGAHTYGLWLASGGMLGMLGLMNFGISSLVIKRVASAYGQKEYTKAGACFINGAVIYIGICLLYAIAGWAASIWLPTILNVTGSDVALLRHCFQLAVVAMTISILNECLRSFAQALLRPVVPMVGMAVGRIFGICVTVWMLFNDTGLWSIPVGMLVAEGIIFILNLFYAFVLLQKLATKICLDRNIIKEYMQTSPALLMARIGNTVSQESEPLLITVFLSPEITAAYMVTRRAADIVSQMLSVIYGATHSAFSNLVGADSERAKKMTCKLLAIVFSSGLIGFVTYVGANDSFVFLWVGQAFSLHQEVIFLIGAGFFIRSFRDMLWQLLNGWGDFIYSSYVILLEGCLRLVLMFVFLNMFGVLGVPLALLLSSSGSGVFLWMRLRKHLLWQNRLGSILRPLVTVPLLFCLSVPIAQFAPNINSWMMFVVYLILLFAMIFLLFVIMNWRMCQWFTREVRA